METWFPWPLPFGSLQDKTEEITLPSCIPKRVCRPRFSSSRVNDPAMAPGVPVMPAAWVWLVAQLVRVPLDKREVGGSSPPRYHSSVSGAVAQLEACFAQGSSVRSRPAPPYRGQVVVIRKIRFAANFESRLFCLTS